MFPLFVKKKNQEQLSTKIGQEDGPRNNKEEEGTMEKGENQPAL